MSFQKEYPAVIALALVMAVRMLGLFMILPVFSLHAGQFAHVSAQLVGLALGVYGLTQALLQIPFGWLSDRIGRKPVMAIGLGIFIAGSICAALSHSIYGLMIGRALQGAGAIGSTVLAMVADLTRDENRSKAMAIIGLAVGASFAVAMAAGPLVDAWAGLAGIFWVTAGLAVAAELLVWVVVPTPPAIVSAENPQKKMGFLQVVKDKELLRLDAGIFALHAMLTAFFIAIPVILAQMVHLGPKAQTGLYLLVLIAAFALMLPLIILAEKKRRMKSVFLNAIAALVLAQLLLLWFHSSLPAVGFLLLLFFTAFSLLEALLPSWVSKVTPLRYKGAAMGCYSTAQFLGIFVGGSSGGWVYAHFGVAGIFALGAGLTLAWLAVTFTLRPPRYLTTVIFNLRQFHESDPEILAKYFYGIAGVTEVAIISAEDLIYLKIDQAILSKLQLRQTLEKSKLIYVYSPHGRMPVGEQVKVLS
jgi:predicted MFS family arabinose efflux permease